jgi:O-antigen ligase
MMLVGTLPLALYFVRRGRPVLTRLLALGVSGLYLLVLLKTGSRGGFLGLIAIGLYVLLTFRALPARVRVVSVVAGFLVLNIFGSDFFWRQMGTLLHPQDDYNWVGKDETGRMEVWKRGIGYMWARPISGVGARAFGVAEGTISPLASRQDLGIGVRWTAAHNSFVQIAAELGVPGILAFIWLLVAAFRALGPPSRQRRGDDPDQRSRAAMAQALRASLIGYAVSGFFLSQAYASFLYATLGLIVALACISPRRSVQVARLARHARASLTTPKFRGAAAPAQ